MNSSVAAAAERVGLSPDAMGAALASYVRSILSGASRFDRFASGERDALSKVEQQGLLVFRGKGNCTACHVGPNFTDERTHNTGVAWRAGSPADAGAGGGAFKTPTLREIARTAPYMHDGSLATLRDVVDFYDAGGRSNPGLDEEIRPLKLTKEEKDALVALLRALSGEVREGLQATGYRLQATGYGLQATGYRRQATGTGGAAPVRRLPLLPFAASKSIVLRLPCTALRSTSVKNQASSPKPVA
jgi:cytochrome c peroxidase